MTNLRWFLVLAVALTLGGAATAQPTTAPETAESKHMARIALVDWVVKASRATGSDRCRPRSSPGASG